MICLRQVFVCRVNRDWCVLALCTSSTLMCICSIRYCVFAQYNEWSTCNNYVVFRLSSQHGFLYSAPLTFLLGQTRKLHNAYNWATEFWYFCVFVNLLVWICVLLCAYLFMNSSHLALWSSKPQDWSPEHITGVW